MELKNGSRAMYVPLVYVVLTYRNTEDLESFFCPFGRTEWSCRGGK